MFIKHTDLAVSLNYKKGGESHLFTTRFLHFFKGKGKKQFVLITKTEYFITGKKHKKNSKTNPKTYLLPIWSQQSLKLCVSF